MKISRPGRPRLLSIARTLGWVLLILAAWDALIIDRHGSPASFRVAFLLTCLTALAGTGVTAAGFLSRRESTPPPSTGPATLTKNFEG